MKRRLSDIEPSPVAFHDGQITDLVWECLQRQNASDVHAGSIQKDGNMIQEIIMPEDDMKIYFVWVYLLLFHAENFLLGVWPLNLDIPRMIPSVAANVTILLFYTFKWRN